ncbi:DUF4185 domain-containing protein [Rhodococcus oxybenzonivorans]|uniref:DUF4185 domain-containing protein n=1 Tax=Rhodococcus oxybenzonivorans TaxID=1990687 RepID=UPI00295551C6|nr:DUF4185 domain-containing protein [Rhodococcus oxybenzonivorans]MDV7354563.1 DUF4185 domain-containing protein [Rhodococcus oxybenzonivorans]
MNRYHPLAPGTYTGVSSGYRTPDRPDHRGVDIAANNGTPIYAPTDGTIAHVGIDDDPQGYGSWLVIDSQNQWGLDFTFGHTPPSSFINPHTGEQWKFGDPVHAGEQIAVVGSEGGSSGPHLHFETFGAPGRFGGPDLDPDSTWLKEAKDPRQAPKDNGHTSLVGKLLVDFSAGVPTAAQIQSGGFAGAIRYISDPRAGWMLGKPLRREEADALRARGMVVVSNFQFGKSDWLGGAEQGRRDAERGIQIHREAGGPETAAIYVSVDASPSEEQWNTLVRPYLLAWQERLGKTRMGVYCNYPTIEWALRDGIGTYFWMHNWGSNGRVHPAAHLHQFEIDKQKVGGVGIDRNRILKEQIGQWDGVAADVPTPVVEPAQPQPVTSPTGYPITWYGGPGYDTGHGAYLRIYLHTTENQDWVARAENVANYQAGAQNGSYHYLIDDHHIINTVSTKNTAWGVLSDNRVSVQIAMVGTSGSTETWSGGNPNREERPKSREQWLAHTKMLDMVAFVIAKVATEYDIPIERVDIGGVGHNRRGVSSHNNYTYGSRVLKGFKDGTHWDVPDTFPYDVVLTAAKRYAGLPEDPDRFPLPPGHYWGPLDGPTESWSNTFGNEPQSSKDGLKRWQQTIGIPGTSLFDKATKDVATRMQQLWGWPVTGNVYEGEWNEVIHNGWRLPAPEPPRPAVPIEAGPKVHHSKKIKEVTGPGLTDRFGMAATDLGVMARTPSGRMLAIFGDTFRGPRVGDGDWRSPVALFSDTKKLDEGIVWSEAAGGDPRYARQLWDYQHDNPFFSTVLPSDVVTIGDTMYLHAMVNKGLGNVVWTEIWKSTDDGHTWQHTGAKFDAGIHRGLAQLWTWDAPGDGWVYVFSTGFQRDKPLILRRVREDRITDRNAYEGWGWKDGAWRWGNEPTPVLERAHSAAKFGEMCLRAIQGKWVLVTFDSSDAGGYDIDVRVFSKITDNLYEAHKSTALRGVGWGQEGDDAVAQLYGPSIVPGSKLDGGFHIFVSQWKTEGPDKGWPYRVLQFKIPVSSPGFRDDGGVNPHDGR